MGVRLDNPVALRLTLRCPDTRTVLRQPHLESSRPDSMPDLPPQTQADPNRKPNLLPRHHGQNQYQEQRAGMRSEREKHEA